MSSRSASLTHYVTGVVLTQAFLLLPRRGRGRPSFLAGTAYGIATAVLPLLVMFPSMGYGWFGLRSGEAGAAQPDHARRPHRVRRRDRAVGPPAEALLA